MNEWNIQSRAHSCQACGKHFVDKHPYHTVLVDERREVARIDLCEPCWAARQSGEGGESAGRAGFISHWQGVYEVPPPAPPEAIKKESAETLLRRIIERNDPSFAAASYILAVMLERKRVLKVKEQFKREGRRIFVYEHPKTADVFTIADPDLQLNQLEQVQRDVASLLEHGLPGDAPAADGSVPAVVTEPGTPAAAEGVEGLESSSIAPSSTAPASSPATEPEPVSSQP